MRLLPVSALLLLSGLTQAQQLSEIPQGLRDATPRWHALTGARLVLAPGHVVENGTLVMKDGVIVAAGADVKPPPGARLWALPGRTVYAGFIDAASSLGQGRVDISKAKALTPGQRWVKADFRQGRGAGGEGGRAQGRARAGLHRRAQPAADQRRLPRPERPHQPA